MLDEDLSATQGAPDGETAPAPAEIPASDTGTEQQTPQTEGETQERAAEPEQPPADDKGKPPAWLQKRFDELTREKHEARRRAEALEAEVARLNGGGEANQGQGDDGSDPQSAIRAEAARIVAEQAFNQSCNETFDKGSAEFTDFAEALGNFKYLGGLPQPLIEAALEAGDAHRVLYQLGKNPEEAARIMALPPTRMAVAVAKLASTPKAPPPLSKAPPPVDPVGSKGAVAPLNWDTMSIEEFARRRAAGESPPR